MRHFKTLLCTGVAAAVVIISGCNQYVVNAGRDYAPIQKNDIDIWPKLDIAVTQSAEQEARVQALLANMTLEQKIAQMIQPEIRDISVEDMRKYGFGSYLNGGGAFPNGDKHATPMDWVTLAENFYQASIDDAKSAPKQCPHKSRHSHDRY